MVRSLMQNIQHRDAYGVSDANADGMDGGRAAKANIISAEETRASDGRTDAATMDCRM